MWVYVFSALFTCLLALAPSHLLVYAFALNEEQRKDVLAPAPLKLWYLNDKLAAYLLTLFEMAKPVLVYVVFRFSFKDDLLALTMASLCTLVSYYDRKLRLKAGSSPLALHGFLLILSPWAGLLFSFVYMLSLIYLRRPTASFSLALLPVPLALILLAPFDFTLTIGLMVCAFHFYELRQSMLSLYPLNERKLPKFL